MSAINEAALLDLGRLGLDEMTGHLYRVGYARIFGGETEYVTLMPEIVEHLIGDHRVTGYRGLPKEIEKAVDQWVRDAPSAAGGGFKSLHISVLRIADAAAIPTREYYDKPGGAPELRLSTMRPDGSLSMTTVPLHYLFAQRLAIKGHYTVYAHLLPDEGSDRMRHYIGITKQGWTSRWRQHMNAANNGSPYLFHEALRRASKEKPDVHMIAAAGLSYEDAMHLEEKLVAGFEQSVPSLYPHGLNMIPGGFAGLAYLGKYGFKNIGPKQWEARSRLLREFGAYCDREHRPNPLMAARWRDDEYARSVIFGNPNNFTEAQVEEIRYMASLDHPVEMITAQFRCDPRRIKLLIEGQTYSRV